MMITWYSNNDVVYHSYQLVSVGLSTLIIAKSCADHHYFEISGKSVMGTVFIKCKVLNMLDFTF